MRNFWVFSRDARDRWRWERYQAGVYLPAASTASFSDCDACVEDAIRHGCDPAEEGIWPPEFKFVAVEPCGAARAKDDPP